MSATTPTGRHTLSTLRFSLTLSGGASLGAYQAGAVAGVVTAITHLADEEDVTVTVDAVGGASAGSLVALCAAHCLLEGIDPVHLLHEAWVEQVSLERLRARGRRAPLSFEQLRDQVPSLLDPRDQAGRPIHRLDRRQEQPIAFHVALTGLQGLTYPVRALRRERPITAATHADWRRFDLEPGGGIRQIVEPEGEAPLDFVLASSANPGAFAPRILNRTRDRNGYERRGIQSFPESGRLWYTDGGLLQSQPVGRVLAAARRNAAGDPEARTVNLLIDPRSEAPSGASEWSDPGFEPTWQEGLSRALAVLPAQALYEDLRRIEKDNSRIRWAEQLVDALEPHLDDQARGALARFIEQVDSERREMREDELSREDERTPGDEVPSARDLLRRAIAETAGLLGKEQVSLDVISPLLLTDDEQARFGGEVPNLLAGEFLGDFGGFLSRALRASDFALGYESALAWLPEGLSRCEIGDTAVQRTVAAVERRRPERWEDVQRGHVELADLPWKARIQLARLGLHTVRVLAAGALDLRSSLPHSVDRTLDRMRALLGRDGR